jgi:predicted O-methyltransferase YrrM
MHIALNKHEVNQIDLTHLAHFLQWNPTYQQYFLQDAGKEPYKLIAFLSKTIGGMVVDMGTLYGSSALALSYNEQTQVMTLDTKRQIPDAQDLVTPVKRPNVRMIVASCQTVLPHAAKANLVLLDIDAHLTTEIKKVIHELAYYNFKGILVLDNIHLNDDMKSLWVDVGKELKNCKTIDATMLGHHTGTGIIVYDPKHIDININ